MSIQKEAAKTLVDMNQPITEAQRKKASDNLRKAKVQVACSQPFFGQVVLGRKVSIEDNCPTAWVTPRGKITLGTRFAAALTVQQLVFVLAHEAMHYILLHPLRRGWREPNPWNYAADAVINDVLKEAKVGEFVPGCVDMPGSKDKTTEKVYDELPRQAGGKGKGKPGGKDVGEPGGTGSDLQEAEDGEGGSGKLLDESERREIEQQAAQELAKAAQVAKEQGKLPAGMERLIDEIVNPKTPWHQLLERFMTNFVASDLSWRRPQRRFVAHRIYMPAADKVPQMGVVVVVIDTSGSIGPKELSHFLGHVNSILERCRPEKVIVIPCDAQAYEPTELTIDDLPITEAMAKRMGKGGGGTSFKPPFKMVEKNGWEPEVLIYLTDMYGDFPDKAPAYSTIWLSTSEIAKAPFGDVIMYRMDDNE